MIFLASSLSFSPFIDFVSTSSGYNNRNVPVNFAASGMVPGIGVMKKSKQKEIAS
jgi:hypothetical protein